MPFQSLNQPVKRHKIPHLPRTKLSAAFQSLSNGPAITSSQLSLTPSTAQCNYESYYLPQGVQGRHSVPDKSNANYSPTFMLSELPDTKTCPLAAWRAPCLPLHERCAQPHQRSVCARTAAAMSRLVLHCTGCRLPPALLCHSLLWSHGVVHTLRFERRYLALQRAFQPAFLSGNVAGVWVQKVTEASSELQRNGFFSSASSPAQASRSFARTDHGHTSSSHETQYRHMDSQSLALAWSQGTHTDQLMLGKPPVIRVLGCPSSAMLWAART